MGQKRTDADILDNAPLVIRFNEIDYEWVQRPRREQRKIRSRLLDIGVLIYGVEGKVETEQAVVSLDAINAILEFCEDYNDDMLNDIDDIENHIKSDGAQGFASLFNDVFQPIFEAWLEPWLTGNTKKKKKTNTRKVKSTK
jgi:hypothetical protein